MSPEYAVVLGIANLGSGDLICVGAFALLVVAAIWIVTMSILAARKKPPSRST